MKEADELVTKAGLRGFTFLIPRSFQLFHHKTLLLLLSVLEWSDLDSNLKFAWIITSEDSFRKQGILSRADRKTSQFLKSQEQRQGKDNLKDENSKNGERQGVMVAGR